MEKKIKNSIDIKMSALKNCLCSKSGKKTSLFEAVEKLPMRDDEKLALLLKLHRKFALDATEISELRIINSYKLVSEYMKVSLPNLNDMLQDKESDKLFLKKITEEPITLGIARGGAAIEVKFRLLSGMIVAEVIAETKEKIFPEQEILCFLRPGYWYTVKFVPFLRERLKYRPKLGTTIDEPQLADKEQQCEIIRHRVR